MGTILLHRPTSGGLYHLSSPSSSPPVKSACVGGPAFVSIWHCKFGYPSLWLIKGILLSNKLYLSGHKHLPVTCQRAKSHTLFTYLHHAPNMILLILSFLMYGAQHLFPLWMMTIIMLFLLMIIGNLLADIYFGEQIWRGTNILPFSKLCWIPIWA